jgi:hypothetical protein
MQRYQGGFIIGVVLLLMLVGFFLLNAQRGQEDRLPIPTAPPTLLLQVTITPTTSPTQPPLPSATPSPSLTPTTELSPTPFVLVRNTQVLPQLPSQTPLPEAPPLPNPVEVALNIEGLGGGTIGNLGRYGGLYDNQRLLNAGHVMLAVPGDAALPTFYIDAYEVTTLQLAAYLNASQVLAQPLLLGDWWLVGASEIGLNAFGQWAVTAPEAATLPAHGVSAWLARAYCANLGGTLPSLAQWQKAAFWAEEGQRPYPWGATPPDHSYAHYEADSTLARDSLDKGRSWVGAFHLVGNVAEWVTLENNQYGIVGGSYADSALDFEQVIRQVSQADPAQPRPEVGFRCVRNN